MSEQCTFEAGTLLWHPATPSERLPDVQLPYVQNDLVTERNPAQALLIAGFGESLASGIGAISLFREYGIPAAAAWLSYSALPVTKQNLERIAIEAPRELAQYLGGGRAMHMFTNSLGCLGVNAATEAPELFASIGVQAPYAFSYATYGRLPLTGSAFDLTRALSVGYRLGLLTPLQLRHHRGDPDIVGVAKAALHELHTLGMVPGTAVRHALSPDLGRRTTDGFVHLTRNGHQGLAIVGRRDQLAKVREVGSGLKTAAIRDGIDPEQAGPFAREHLHVAPGPHAPWCSPEGQIQLRYAALWLRSQLELTA